MKRLLQSSGRDSPTGSHAAIPDARRTLRLAQLGFVVNAVLTIVKLVAGILGNASALVADAVESAADMIGSVVVWGGLRIANRDPDDRYPFGYGRAEPLAAGAVAALLLGASTGVSIVAIREILTPHSAPEPYTLVVLFVVIAIKIGLYLRVDAASSATGSVAAKADAWHHRADAITSGAAFIGIAVALIGGPGWEQADDWAALVAAAVIAANGLVMLRSAARDLMDRAPDPELLSVVTKAALQTIGVLAIEKLKIRKSGTSHYVDIHVQADPTMTLHDAHQLSGMVKGAIKHAVPSARGVLIHMEPYET